MKWMTLLALLAVGSTIWSQSPSRSFLYGSCYLLSTLFAYYLVLRFDDDQLMELVTLTGAAVSVLCVIFVVALPQYGISYRDPRSPGAWVGIFPARTGVAQVLTFLLTPALILRDSRRHWRQLAYVLLVVFLILMSRPVTALILMCLYAGSVAWLYLLRITKRRTAWSIGFAVISVLMLLVILVVPQMPLLFGLFGRDATISGRTVIWQGLLESFAKRPLLGYGYSAFWQGLNGESAKAILGAHWIFAYAHNGLLEIMLQVGLVGLIIFFITLIKAFKDGWFCLAHGQTPGVEWCVGLLLLTCMYNIDEETLLFPKDLLSILYIVACTSLARHAARLKSDLNRNHGQNTGYLYSE
jgi:exopolysaccharide production protein ExoQ